jgi:hypothetical protein
MAELEHELRELAAAVEWPTTPPVRLHLEPRPKRERLRPLWIALAALALALAVAFSVPSARSAILRVLHLGGVSVQRVSVLPPAEVRPLGADLGVPVDARTAREVLGVPMRLPSLERRPPLYQSGVAISTLFVRRAPVLLTEFRSGSVPIFKKILSGGTTAVGLRVGTAPGIWISGQPHVFEPVAVPARLAGNVLIWQVGEITFRLEGRHLTKQDALDLAAEIEHGT